MSDKKSKVKFSGGETDEKDERDRTASEGRRERIRRPVSEGDELRRLNADQPTEEADKDLYREVLESTGFTIANEKDGTLKQQFSDSETESVDSPLLQPRSLNVIVKSGKNGKNKKNGNEDRDDAFLNQVKKAFVPSFMHTAKHKFHKNVDHTPFRLFIELLELQSTNSGVEWRETARWIKYEENVEGVENRWGRPHIAILNFNALFELKKMLETEDLGAVLLDIIECDLAGMAKSTAQFMYEQGIISEDNVDSVNGILLMKRNHNKEGLNEFKEKKRKGSKRPSIATPTSGKSIESLNDTTVNVKKFRRGSATQAPQRKKSLGVILTGRSYDNFKTDIEGLGEKTWQQKRRKSVVSALYSKVDSESDVEISAETLLINSELLRKLPENAQAACVHVGCVDFLDKPAVAFVRLREGVFMKNLVEVPIPVRFLFVVIGPKSSEYDYHEIGRAFSTLLSDKHFYKIAYRAQTKEDITQGINEFLEHTIVFPPSDWKNEELVPLDTIRNKANEFQRKKEKKEKEKVEYVPSVKEIDIRPVPSRDPLERKGKLFYGFIKDIKIRYPKYWSDIKDGFNTQVLSTIIFLFFATLSSAVAFGGIYGEFTHGLIGVTETLLLTGINGIIFALFAGQPLLIVGASGPLMVFDYSLQKFTKAMDVDFLSVRVWIGLWLLVIGFIVIAFELEVIVKKFTRFTEEIFSTLVCIIFIVKSLEKLAKVFIYHPLYTSDFYYSDENHTDIVSAEATTANSTEHEKSTKKHNEPNTALLSMVIYFLTFVIAWKLKHFRNSKFLGRGIRRTLGDFGVPIAIFLMVLIDYFIQDTYTTKLSMPVGMQPTLPSRGWFMNPLGVYSTLPIWAMFVALPGAMLVFILIFLEANICQLIMSKPERNLVKGTGFHLDIFLSCFVNVFSCLLGAPFMGPATVKSIVHLSALTIVSTNVAPGESPKVVGCHEQRLSALFVAILNGCSVFLSMVLNYIPTSVLFGIFLYMGVSAAVGIQFLERLVLFLKPVKHHPNVPYVKKVRTRKMHLYTLIQLFLIVILWIVKQSPAALAMPFILMLLIPIRFYLLPLMFSRIELVALDGKDPIAAEDPDFYEAAHDLPILHEKAN